jgi:hypothetical protein
MTGWTLSQVKARGLQLEGCCQTEGCGHFYRFDLEALIARAGADYAVPEFIPDMDCLQCGGRLKVYLAAIPENEPQA